MKQTSRRFLPTSLETWGIASCTLLVLLLGNAHDLLQRYGLIKSSQIVHDQLTNGVGQGLRKLDSYSLTQNATTFVVWGVIGIIAFTIFQAVWRTSQQLKYEQEVSSNQYIHPLGFDRNRYWRSILLGSLLSLVLLGLVVTALVFYVFEILPNSVRHTGSFLLAPSLVHASNLALGLVLGFVGTYVVYTLIKLYAVQHRALKQ